MANETTEVTQVTAGGQETEITEVTEGLTEEETVVETEGQESNEGEQEESTEFNPDDLEFEEEEGDFTFGDYNLSRFKDDINLSDDNIRNFLNEKAKILKEKGFNQSQVEFIIEEEIKEARAKQVTKHTKEDIIKDLKENLTVQERKDYKNVGNYLKDGLKGTELEGYYNEAMSNPIVYKLIHSLYTKTLSGKPIGIGTTKETKEIKKAAKTFDQATNEYLEYLTKHSLSNEDTTKGIESIIKDLSKEDREIFKNTFLKK